MRWWKMKKCYWCDLERKGKIINVKDHGKRLICNDCNKVIRLRNLLVVENE